MASDNSRDTVAFEDGPRCGRGSDLISPHLVPHELQTFFEDFLAVRLHCEDVFGLVEFTVTDPGVLGNSLPDTAKRHCRIQLAGEHQCRYGVQFREVIESFPAEIEHVADFSQWKLCVTE